MEHCAVYPTKSHSALTTIDEDVDQSLDSIVIARTGKRWKRFDHIACCLPFILLLITNELLEADDEEYSKCHELFYYLKIIDSFSFSVDSSGHLRRADFNSTVDQQRSKSDQDKWVETSFSSRAIGKLSIAWELFFFLLENIFPCQYRHKKDRKKSKTLICTGIPKECPDIIQVIFGQKSSSNLAHWRTEKNSMSFLTDGNDLLFFVKRFLYDY